MDSSVIAVGPVLAVVLVLLVAAAAALVALGQLGLTRGILVAAGRAVLQLGLVSLVIVAVVRSGPLVAGFVTVMYAVAVGTAARRITRHRSGVWVALPIALSVAPVLALVLVTGLVPLTGIAVVPIAGILIGNAMTASALAGKRCLEELRVRRGEYEAALALGFTDRDAAAELCRPAGALALVPPIDQTRTVGLVTLPGAFVGVLLGGGSPVQAGATQLLILIGLLAVEAAAVLAVVELTARRLLREA
ncbi:MAG: ABC transporter permease [Micromonosporaceae bacterium]